METSCDIGSLVAALAKAQGSITGALKDSANPFFKSKYADLASCWDACRDALSSNEIAVVQGTSADDTGVTVTTTLAHSSGQWMRSSLRMVPKDSSPQGIGSAVTYGRRYGLTAMVGIAQIDDDGNAASKPEQRELPKAYEKPHTPRGDVGKDVSVDKAREVATVMRELLERDIDEAELSLLILEKNRELNKDQESLTAAWAEMSSKERAAWTKYCAMGKDRSKAAMSPTGRAA